MFKGSNLARGLSVWSIVSESDLGDNCIIVKLVVKKQYYLYANPSAFTL